MSPGSLFAFACRLRSERGQTSAEYVGILVVVCAIVVVLLNSGIGDLLAAKLKAQIALVATDQESGGGGSTGGKAEGGGNGSRSGEGSDQANGGAGSPSDGAPDASGRPGTGRDGGTGSTGGSGLPGGNAGPLGPAGSGGTGAPGTGRGGSAGDPAGGPAGARSENAPFPCTRTSVAAIQGCASSALGLPAYLKRRNIDLTKKELARAQTALERAKPGTPAFAVLVGERDKRLRAFRAAKKLRTSSLVRAGTVAKDLVDPSASALDERFRSQAAKDAAAKAARTAPTTSAAKKVVSGGGKFVRGLGVAGTLLGGYNNVQKDGVGKGLFKTAAGAGAAYGTGLGVGALCVAAGVATAGVGAVACGVGAVVASGVASKYASDAAGYVWDKAPKVASAVKNAAGTAGKFVLDTTVVEPAKKVAEGLDTAKKGIEKVGSVFGFG